MRTALVAIALAGARVVSALGEQQVLHFPPHDPQSASSSSVSGGEQVVLASPTKVVDEETDLFVLYSHPQSHALPILLDSRDDVAIHLAAKTFAKDVHKVTGLHPSLYNDTLPKGVEHAVVLCSADSGLLGSGDVQGIEEIKGKWESYDVRVRKGIAGTERSLVVTGSDRVCVSFGD